jgi:hypothetical protein
LTDTYSALADVSVAFMPPPSSVLGRLADLELLTAQKEVAEIRRRTDAFAAALTREAAYRSRPALGHDGLAARLGSPNVENLVQKVTGATLGEARSLVKVATLLPVDDGDERPDAVATPTWLVAVGSAVAEGRLSIEAAAAIRTGVGVESEAVSAGDLAGAVAVLLREAPGITVERLGVRARELRAELDLEHVREREAALRDKRYLNVTPQSDGMTRISGLLDPVSAAVVIAAFDASTSPRRGGPRFVDTEQAGRADDLTHDERTTGQIAVDTFVHLLQTGAAVDPDILVGRTLPAVRVLVAERDLRTGRGLVTVEGQSEPVSVETAEGLICESGLIGVMFDDDGQVVNIGRELRLFSRRQRIGMAARDGGCRWPGCTKPVSWTEAHHINSWVADHGLTNVEDGVLLCRFHHLLLHNNNWRIVREVADYFLVPPADVDPEQRRIPMPPKSPAVRRLLASAVPDPGRPAARE